MGKQTKRKVSSVDKKRSKKGEKKKRKTDRERGRGEREKKRFSQRFDDWSSTVREEKLIRASQATCGYQNLEVSSNSMRWRIFLHGIFFSLKAM